jgi:PiT family inorganic phosphate transporter
MAVALLFLATLFLAYSNGANDNFKGVATLLGSNVASYRTAIALATVTTFAGSICSLAIAEQLVKTFSGQGLVPAAIAASPHFLIAIATGAGCTVILATVLGFPVSTTHGLTGALIGAGAVAAGADMRPGGLISGVLAPLVISPVLAIAVTVPLYKLLHGVRLKLDASAQSCVCIGMPEMATASGPGFGSGVSVMAFQPAVTTGDRAECRQGYAGQVIGVSVQQLVDAGHFVSASAVSFARGLNDTPKIVGLVFAVHAFQLSFGIPAIAVAMAIGGLINARKVARTMSRGIAQMNDGQAFTANLVTAFLVIFASRWGLPVSTTHVTVGAITGVGVVNGSVNKRALSGILMSWVLTLPIAAAISAVGYAGLGLIMG